jgi:hypothetical protein
MPFGPLATAGESVGEATGVGVGVGVDAGVATGVAVGCGVVEGPAVGDAEAAGVGVAVGAAPSGAIGATDVAPEPHASRTEIADNTSIARKIGAFIANDSSRKARSGDRAVPCYVHPLRASMGVNPTLEPEEPSADIESAYWCAAQT